LKQTVKLLGIGIGQCWVTLWRFAFVGFVASLLSLETLKRFQSIKIILIALEYSIYFDNKSLADIITERRCCYYIFFLKLFSKQKYSMYYIMFIYFTISLKWSCGFFFYIIF